MAINPALLITDNTLQENLVDVTGVPLAGGIVTFYEDNSRTTLKNVYELSGSPGSYTYTVLPNPLTLSASGTVIDGSGNDTKIFYYPVSETDNTTPQFYYITIQNSNGTVVATRQDFPSLNGATGGGGGGGTGSSLNNLLVNGEFWRNAGTVTTSTLTNATLVPGAHDGFSMPDIQWFKDVNDGTETIAFTKFLEGAFLGTTNADPTPEYYLNYTCTAAGTSTTKYVQIPIQLHVKNLEQAVATFTMYAQSVSGADNISINLYQFLGTGGSTPTTTTITTQTLSIGWFKIVTSFAFPSAGNTTTSPGDDAWYLQINFPVGAAFSINIAKPGIYIGETTPTNEWNTYDVIGSVFDSPRTGDIRTSLNAFYPFGWVPMNDGSIGNAASSATNRANTDTWQLYNLIWNSVPDAFAAVSTGRGANAISDFNANKNIALTKALGRALLGGGALPTKYGQTYTTNFAGNNNLTVASSAGFYTGAPVQVSSTGTLSAPLVAGTVYYAIYKSATTFSLATTQANAYALTEITLTGDGTGTQTANTYLLGGFAGEEMHTLTIAEMPSHNHPGTTIGGSSSENVGNFFERSDTNAVANAITIASQGGGSAHNTVQPSVYYNLFIKL